MSETAFKNHSQLADARMSPQELWRKKLHRNRDNKWGFETPLGHTYSLILEALVEEGIQAQPDPAGFLDHIKGFLEYYQGWYEESRVRMTSPSFEIGAIIDYMNAKGLSKKSRSKIFEEITGDSASYRSSVPGI